MPSDIENTVERYILEQAANGRLELSSNQVKEGLRSTSQSGSAIDRALWKLEENGVLGYREEGTSKKTPIIITKNSWKQPKGY